MIRLSSCEIATVERLLRNPSQYFLCYRHLNHSKHARYAAKRRGYEPGETNHGFCIFRSRGCSLTGKQQPPSVRLRKIPFVDIKSLNNLEELAQLEDSVHHHSQNTLRAVDVMGKYCCSNCLYIVSEGKYGSSPSISVQSLPDAVDRMLVRCVLHSMQELETCESWPLPEHGYGHQAYHIATSLRSVCISSKMEGRELRMLPFTEVVQCREMLRSLYGGSPSFDSKKIDDRTLQKRIETVLAAKGILLQKLSHKLRCYISADAVDMMLNHIAVSKSFRHSEPLRPSVSSIRSMLRTVSNYFMSKKDALWKGEWSLSNVVEYIPTELWTDFVMTMASDRRLASWRLVATASKKSLDCIFPVSNRGKDLPKPSIEEALNCRESVYCRDDLLLCVRTLKVIEQTVFARTNGIAGPLTISLSIAGICEVTPSFVSVLNALGLLVSYGRTEQYRQELIAERERVGSWDTKILDEVTMPSFQFDNWDIKPLHAVKVDGKAMPKINGSLLQGQTRKRKRDYDFCYDKETKRKRERNSTWKSVSLLGDRGEFTDNTSSKANRNLLNQFNNVVFGITSLYRKQLLGGTENTTEEYNTAIRDEFCHEKKGPAINFRTLLLSCFKPHGGRNMKECSFSDQHVVYVEISRDSASDILTVRRFLLLIQQMIRPGEEGRPRYVVVAGDQPSFKMFVELWLISWRSTKSGNGGQDIKQLPLHEWLIAFPGFFHAEKQAMYAICKELMDGLGLEEMAGCAGLSASHVENFVSHSHARNNRAVLFNMACAMLIHVTDMILMEDHEVGEVVARMH